MSAVSIADGHEEFVYSPQQEKRREIKKRSFVLHRYGGREPHYELKFQLHGVLKCWVLPNGPSMNCNQRRLAIMSKDKPLSHARIRTLRCQYPGEVESWDKGVIVAHSVFSSGCSDEDILKQMEEGRLRFTLNGKKLKGVFSLVRIDDPGAQRWLLLKGNDRFAVDYPYDPEQHVPDRAVRDFWRNDLLREGARYLS